GGGEEEVALAGLEELGVEGGVVEVGLGGAPPLERVRLAEADLDALAELAEEGEEVEVLELLLVAGEEALGDLEEEHRVVALERREDVGVGAEGGEAVGVAVALAAAGLAGLLDGVGGVAGGERLERGGLRLDGADVGPGRRALEAAGEVVEGEREAVGGGDVREQPALVAEVVEDGDLGAVRRPELPAAGAVADGD